MDKLKSELVIHKNCHYCAKTFNQFSNFEDFQKKKEWFWRSLQFLHFSLLSRQNCSHPIKLKLKVCNFPFWTKWWWLKGKLGGSFPIWEITSRYWRAVRNSGKECALVFLKEMQRNGWTLVKCQGKREVTENSLSNGGVGQRVWDFHCPLYLQY